MNWYVIDKDYITYLLQFDSRVGYVEYGDRLKLHVGVGVSQSLCKPPNWCKIELLSLEVFLWQEKKTAHKKQQ